MFFAYGVIMTAAGLWWCFRPWNTSSSVKTVTIATISIIVGLALMLLDYAIHLQPVFMLQFGIPAVLALLLYFRAVKHEEGRPVGPSHATRITLLLVALAVIGIILEVAEIVSVGALIISALGSLALIEAILFFGQSTVEEEFNPAEKQKTEHADDDQPSDAAALEGPPAVRRKTPRGLPDNPFLTRGVVLLMAVLEGIGLWREGPVLNWHFTDVADFFFNVAVGAVIITALWNFIGNKSGAYGKHKRSLVPNRFAMGLLAITIMTSVVFPTIASSPFFWWQRQADVIGHSVKYGTLDELVQLVGHSNSNQPRLPAEVAYYVAGQRLGGVVGPDGSGSLGKTSKFGHLNLVTLNASFTATGSDGKREEMKFHGQPVWVGPLEPTNPFIQLLRGPTNGYVIMDANTHNLENGRLVTTVNGKALKIKYHCNGGYFSANVRRYLYRQWGYRTLGLSEGRFIIDAEGTPFCLVAGYTHATGFNTPVPERLILVDVQTGEVKDYPLGEQPEWIDQAYLTWMWEIHLNNWGNYREGGKFGNGWLHKAFDGTGVMVSSGEIARMEVQGKTYFFTTMTDGKSATAIAVGDARTRQTTIYPLPNGGITENAAVAQVISNDPAISTLMKSTKDESAHGKVSQPLPMVVDGRLVYQVVATNMQGAPYRVALTGIDLVGVTGVGDSFPQALAPLRRRLQEALANSGEAIVTQGRLRKVEVVTEPGEATEFWVYLDEHPSTAFAIPAKSAPWLPGLNGGTPLAIETKGKPLPDAYKRASEIRRQ